MTGGLAALPRGRLARPGSSRGLVVAGGLASIVLGALCARSTTLAAGGMVAILGCTLVAVSPALWLAVGLATLTAAPELMPFAHGALGSQQVYKSLLYLAVLPMIALRGVRGRYALPLIAYLIVTTTAEIAGTHPDNLTPGQTASSLATLCIGWVFLIVAWDWERDHRFLKLIAALPVLSVVVGAALTPLGWKVFQPYASPPRLQGAEIAALLGGTAVASTVAAIVLYRRAGWRPAVPLGISAVVVTAASLGRGAITALIIAAAPAGFRIVRGLLGRKGGESYLKFLVAGLAISAVVAFAVVPALNSRANSVSYNAITHTATKDSTSGRVEAWRQFYQAAEVNLVWGRGMGTGPIIKIGQVGFQAQHNEYLRMVLEVGYAGGILLLIAMIIAVTRVLRDTPAIVRADAIALAVALAVYSATDNTLTSRHLAVPFLATLAIAAAPIVRERRQADAAPALNPG
jgi:hypothetical protein